MTREILSRYIDHVERVQASNTHSNRRTGINQFEAWLDETGREVESIGPLEVQYFLADMVADGYAASTIDAAYDSIRGLYSYLEMAGEIETDPTTDVDHQVIRPLIEGPGIAESGEVLYVTPADRDAVLEHVPTPAVRNRVIVQVLWQTGLRASELVGMDRSDIDREQRTIHVAAPKTNDTRTVVYQPVLDALLVRYLDFGYRNAFEHATTDGALFPSKSSPRLSTDRLRTVIRDAATAAGVREVVGQTIRGDPRHRITPHAFRHGHAVHALESGINIRAVQRQLGHASIDTTERYLQLVDADVRRAYRTFG